MVALLYPRDDEEAAYYAYRLKALAAGQGISVVLAEPLTPARIRQIASKAEGALFIAFDPAIRVNPGTLKIAQGIIRRGKPIVATVPEGYPLPFEPAYRVEFDPDNPKPDALAEALDKLMEYIREHKIREAAPWVLGALFAVLVLMLSVAVARGEAG